MADAADADAAAPDATVAVVRERREGLHAALVAFEQAIAAPAPGRERAWADTAGAALTALRAAFTEHVTATEADSGLFAQVRCRAPRLDHACHVLSAEHRAIDASAEAVAAALPGNPTAGREAALALLALLGRHRQRGADLMFEAYAVDIGGSD